METIVISHTLEPHPYFWCSILGQFWVLWRGESHFCPFIHGKKYKPCSESSELFCEPCQHVHHAKKTANYVNTTVKLSEKHAQNVQLFDHSNQGSLVIRVTAVFQGAVLWEIFWIVVSTLKVFTRGSHTFGPSCWHVIQGLFKFLLGCAPQQNVDLSLELINIPESSSAQLGPEITWGKIWAVGQLLEEVNVLLPMKSQG